MASWRDSTQKQHAGYLQKWQRFCSGRKVDMFSPPVEEVLHFPTEESLQHLRNVIIKYALQCLCDSGLLDILCRLATLQ